MTIQDFGVGYEELEPCFDQFERVCGTSGKAGNLNGTIVAGGNPFEDTDPGIPVATACRRLRRLSVCQSGEGPRLPSLFRTRIECLATLHKPLWRSARTVQLLRLL